MKIRLLFLIIALTLYAPGNAQAPEKLSSSDIYHEIEKLNFLGTVLYLAAHPDDENTRMISYFSNEVHARTAYLSITRGDGGQNLIGPEIRELLGVIRTNELLRARQTDGGEQFFTRANDFGYSKHPDETLEIWKKEKVLNDVVRVMREFQPDIIINRFDAESAGRTHGHHTSSAMLSLEAFDLAPDKDYDTPGFSAWEPKRIFFNTHWWFYGSREKFEEVDKSKMLYVDIGTYYNGQGLSNSEIASLSRSMHKSQGFGSTGTRGSEMEYLQLLKGTMPKEKSDIFEGINTTWSRVKGGQEIQKILEQVQEDYDFENPAKSVPALMQAYELIAQLENKHWRAFKTQQIKDIIAACLGLYLEGVSAEPYSTLGDKLDIEVEAINRSPVDIELKSVWVLPMQKEQKMGKDLPFNTGFKEKMTVQLPDNLGLTSPYWLDKPWSLGMYDVDDRAMIGEPVTPRSLRLQFNMEIDGHEVSFERDVVYKYNDPVRGEVYQPFEIVPEVSSSIRSKVVLFDDNSPREIPVVVNPHKDGLSGTVRLQAPEGWGVEPKSAEFDSKSKEEEVVVRFMVTPPQKQSEGVLKPIVETSNGAFDKSLVEIDYEHIPKQMVFLPSGSKVVRLDLNKKMGRIGYINGAGDEVAKYLKQIGYEVREIDPKLISERSLSQYDAVILGIRAYNTVDELVVKQAALLNYVRKGGTMIVQYNTNRTLKVEENLAPYELKLSRQRITDENAEVTFLAPNHELMNYPNKIEKSDFDGWVQERGLYFPGEWSDEFTPLFSFEENGEGPMEGSLLVAKYGEGHYIYTGLSFFRELPAGVPGAYKLFANMLSIGRNELETELKK
jgi:LmbE family N-acetylglucosaminyl deacetylase